MSWARDAFEASLIGVDALLPASRWHEDLWPSTPWKASGLAVSLWVVLWYEARIWN